MIRLIPIDNVFNYISPSLREQIQDDEQMLSWAYQRYRTSQNPLRYVKDVELVEVENHLAEVPKGAIRIWRVLNLTEPFDLSEFEELQVKGVSYPDETIDQARNLVYHDIFLASIDKMNVFQPMRYAGVSRTDNFVRTVNENCCKETWSLTQDNCHIRTSFPEGALAIEFLAGPMTESGMPLIPEDPPELWQGLAHHAEAQAWRDRMHNKEQAAFSFYQSLLGMANQYMREANAFLSGKHLRMDLARAQIYGPSRMLNIHKIAKRPTV